MSDSDTFNLAALREVLKQIPVVAETPKYFICNPEGYVTMRELMDTEIKISDPGHYAPGGFINIWQKPDQLRRCWAFSNIQTAMAYLQGDITEAEIAVMAGEGFGV